METILANSLAVLSVAYAITLLHVLLQRLTLRNYRFMQGVHADRIERLIAERDALAEALRTTQAERDEATKQLVEMAERRKAAADRASELQRTCDEQFHNLGRLRDDVQRFSDRNKEMHGIAEQLQFTCNELRADAAKTRQERDDLAKGFERELEAARLAAADIERRCDVELARRTEAWKARIAELERENADIDKHYNAGWSDAVRRAEKCCAAMIGGMRLQRETACCGVDTSEQEEAS